MTQMFYNENNIFGYKLLLIEIAISNFYEMQNHDKLNKMTFRNFIKILL